jgi:hypothetical protein
VTAVPPAVFLLQSRLREDNRVLVLDDGDRLALMGWQLKPGEYPRPRSLDAHWEGDPAGRPSRFPSYMLETAILIPEVVAAMAEELGHGGSLVPLQAADDGIVVKGVYRAYLAETVVDCLDEAASSEPQQYTNFRRQVAFHADRLPDTPAFRVPQTPTITYWNRGAAERIQAIVGDDVQAWVVWSQDPTLPVHPNPMATRM